MLSDLRFLMQEEHGECSSNDYEEPVDNATLVQITSDDGHQYDFHIVYSLSYNVPVLYFRAHSSGMSISTSL
ncbi:hypothetical protein HanXRQr2_Chr03g0124571 [Helianthus annuus]|uniref:Ubiquitin-like-conjugating enzyme ATG10 n=1 Tax=Helianthus annuus TaxID=4232 RepID=A0A9K3NXZ7_HELAN|nr:hypothetical protein HanXRQr2_Chr03g0124571 [Helianthus annuus]KAJ0594013.1 hypothetical protein HanHA300_Chr03g0103821 [Helianthus annuus]KAJ0602077.1 hypothetical protein HanIR_Chr03g0135741 [Helianthus annuus]KAJ0609034.1 hypothetical protein HanHA89_Chr03g0115461 [Helianthus annuus]KAJ0769098.1 hypothetical protein HanLR1_Chr03g0109041 [Helianthus annuus]